MPGTSYLLILDSVHRRCAVSSVAPAKPDSISVTTIKRGCSGLRTRPTRPFSSTTCAATVHVRKIVPISATTRDREAQSANVSALEGRGVILGPDCP